MIKLNLQQFSEEAKEPEEVKEPEAKEPEKELEPEAKPTPAPPSSKPSDKDVSIKHLAEQVALIAETTDKTFKLAKESREEMAEAGSELRETTALLQNLIGEMDHKLEALAGIAAALVKLHKEATKTES